MGEKKKSFLIFDIELISNFLAKSNDIKVDSWVGTRNVILTPNTIEELRSIRVKSLFSHKIRFFSPENGHFFGVSLRFLEL